MTNVKFIEIEEFEGKVVTHAIIENEDGSFTSMPKAVWDELQAKQTEGGLI